MPADQETQETPATPVGNQLKKKKRQRGGHRASTTTTLNACGEILKSYTSESKVTLKKWRITLEEKLQIFSTQNLKN